MYQYHRLLSGPNSITPLSTNLWEENGVRNRNFDNNKTGNDNLLSRAINATLPLYGMTVTKVESERTNRVYGMHLGDIAVRTVTSGI